MKSSNSNKELYVSPTPTNKKLWVVMLAVVSVLMLDTITTKISVLISQELISLWRMIIFAIISTVFIAGQYLILAHIKSRNLMVAKIVPHIHTIHRIVTGVQYTLVAILVVAVFQIVVGSSYSLSLITAATLISYTLAILLLGLLSHRFFSWFKTKGSYIIFFYGFSSVALSLTAALTLAFSVVILQDKPELVLPRVGTLLPLFEPGSLKDVLDKSYKALTAISFIATWISTTLLLKHHGKGPGKILYWIIVSIPLIYFLSQYLDLFMHLLDPLVQQSPVLNSIFLILIFTLSKPVGGVLFGVAFRSVAHNVKHEIVRDYMTIAAYGLVLLFITNQAISTVNSPSYPPFGLVTISFMGLASYLMLVGIQYSAISVSHDVDLRKSIRRFAINELSLLDNIGSAEQRLKIENGMKEVLKKNQEKLLEETGVQTSLDEEEVKEYLEEVLTEIGRKRDS